MVAPAPPPTSKPSAAAALPVRPPYRATALSSALGGSEPLAALLLRLKESERRWAAIKGALPVELALAVRPGPWADDAWVLLADHAAAAAKLRQCLPSLEAAVLQLVGSAGPPIKVKVRPRE
jgi:hypothetical protein